MDEKQLSTAQMPQCPSHPLSPEPEGGCDAHVHLVAAADEFPLWERRVENPAPGSTFDGSL